MIIFQYLQQEDFIGKEYISWFKKVNYEIMFVYLKNDLFFCGKIFKIVCYGTEIVCRIHGRIV